MYKLLIVICMILFVDLSKADSNQTQSCSTNSTWSQTNGLIVAGGDSSNLTFLNFLPFDFALDSQLNVYIADINNTRIIMYSNNYTVGQFPTVIVSNVSCQHLFIDQYDNLYFIDNETIKILNYTTGNITNFANSYYDTVSAQYVNFVSPSGLYVDANSRLYVIDAVQGVLVRYVIQQSNNGTILADRNHGLNYPQCIFVDETDNNTFYICDLNSTITKYINDGANWTIIIDGRTTSNNTTMNISMSFDSAIVDSLTHQLYISDVENSHITRWSLSNNTQQGEIVIQFQAPMSQKTIKFDKDRNLYVAVTNNITGQILKFVNCHINQTNTTSTSTTLSITTTTTPMALNTTNTTTTTSITLNTTTTTTTTPMILNTTTTTTTTPMTLNATTTTTTTSTTAGATTTTITTTSTTFTSTANYTSTGVVNFVVLDIYTPSMFLSISAILHYLYFTI